MEENLTLGSAQVSTAWLLLTLLPQIFSSPKPIQVPLQKKALSRTFPSTFSSQLPPQGKGAQKQSNAITGKPLWPQVTLPHPPATILAPSYIPKPLAALPTLLREQS